MNISTHQKKSLARRAGTALLWMISVLALLGVILGIGVAVLNFLTKDLAPNCTYEQRVADPNCTE